MRITVRSKRGVRFSKNQFSFYMKYASFVLRTLRKPRFQKFLHWMLKRENIQERVKIVRVRMFPFRKENGKGIAGKCKLASRCNNEWEISIFPKKLEFCRRLIPKFGKEKFFIYVRSRARATLIHELLHLKYSNDEEKVRELTKEYFAVFTQNRPAQSSHRSSLYNMIFKPEVIKNVFEHVCSNRCNGDGSERARQETVGVVGDIPPGV